MLHVSADKIYFFAIKEIEENVNLPSSSCRSVLKPINLSKEVLLQEVLVLLGVSGEVAVVVLASRFWKIR